MENPPKWGSDILKEIIATEDYLSKNVDGVSEIYRRAEDAANEYIRTNDKVAVSMDRIVEESNLMNGISTFGNSQEAGVAFLRILKEIDDRYEGTYSSISSKDIGKILRDQFNIDIPMEAIEEFDFNLTKLLKTIDEDADGVAMISNELTTLDAAFGLSASKIALSMQQMRMAVGNQGSFMTTALSESNKPLDKLRNKIDSVSNSIKTKLTNAFNPVRDKINNVANVASVVGTRIANAFSPVRDKVTVVGNTINNKLSTSLNKFFNESKRVWNQFNSSLGNVKNNIQQFGSKLSSLVKNIPGLKRVKKEVI